MTLKEETVGTLDPGFHTPKGVCNPGLMVEASEPQFLFCKTQVRMLTCGQG